jgi:hypothetical protein
MCGIIVTDGLDRKMGQAVGFARDCKADLKAIQHSSLSKAHIRKSAIAARAAKEEEVVTELLQKYNMINDTVSLVLTRDNQHSNKYYACVGVI